MVYEANGLVGLDICERGLSDEKTRALAAISLSPSVSLGHQDIVTMKRLELMTVCERIRGRKKAYNVSKEINWQLSETGMNWQNIAICLRISKQTLFRSISIV